MVVGTVSTLIVKLALTMRVRRLSYLMFLHLYSSGMTALTLLELDPTLN